MGKIVRLAMALVATWPWCCNGICVRPTTMSDTHAHRNGHNGWFLEAIYVVVVALLLLPQYESLAQHQNAVRQDVALTMVACSQW
jgi:hypothetical protein